MLTYMYYLCFISLSSLPAFQFFQSAHLNHNVPYNSFKPFMLYETLNLSRFYFSKKVQKQQIKWAPKLCCLYFSEW